MIFDEIHFTLKNGQPAVLVPPTGDMAAEMLEYLRDIARETEFITRTANEVSETVDQEREFLEHVRNAENRIMLVCLVDGEIAGNCNVSYNRRLKMRHRCSLGIAIREKYWNLGIGTKLMETQADFARAWGLRQMELEMVDGNARGLALYTKMGYVVTGRRPDAFLMGDGTYRDEILMTKML